MIKSKNILYFILCVLINSCCTEEMDHNTPLIPITGKIKKITTYNTLSSSDTLNFDFYYDSTSGYLSLVKSNNRDYIRIQSLNNNLIKIVYDNNAPYSTNDSSLSYILRDQYLVHLDNKGRIDKIANIDTITTSEIFSVNLFTNNGNLDSINSSNDFYKIWNCEYYNQNIQIFNRFWKPNPIFPASIDTISLQYAEILNDGQVPMQYFIYPFGGVNFGTDILYILSLSGYNAYKPNKNLISKIIIHEQTGAINTINREYVTNSNGKVTKLTISIDNDTVTFILEYY